MLFSYCFLPYKRRFSKFLIHLEQDKGKLGCATQPKKKLQKLPSLHSSRFQTSLQHGPRVFLPWQSQLSSKHRAMAPRGRQKSLKDLNLPLRWIPSSPWWTTHWLSNYAVHSKFPWQGWPGGKSTNTKPDSQGCPGSAFAHFTKKWREKHGFPVEGILNVRRVCEVCIPNSCLFTFFLNRFIDLTINSRISPFNLASSRLLWVWDPYGVWRNCCELKL